jgi:hypothetical protein
MLKLSQISIIEKIEGGIIRCKIAGFTKNKVFEFSFSN